MAILKRDFMRFWVLLLLMINLLFADINLNDRLKEFTEDFKSKRNEKKYFTEISDLSVEKQRELLNRYDSTVSIINPNNIPEDKADKKLLKSLNNNVKYIIKFYDAVHSWRAVAEDKAKDHEKKVPELQWTQIMQIEKQEWQIADIKAKIELEKERLKWKWLTQEIKRIEEESKRIEEEGKRIEEEGKRIEEELKKWKLLNWSIKN